MNGFDVAALAVLAVAAVVGALLGVVRMVLGIVSLLTATVLAITFAERAAALLAPHISSPQIASMVGFILVYTVVLIGFAVSAWLIRKSLASLGIRWLDRTIGGLIGIGAAVVLTAGMAYGLRAVAPAAEVVGSSTTLPYLVRVADRGIQELPESWRTRIQDLSRSPPAPGDRHRPMPAPGAEDGEAGK